MMLSPIEMLYGDVELSLKRRMSPSQKAELEAMDIEG